MCNYVDDAFTKATKIKKTGYGWKLFKSQEEPFRPLCAGGEYTNINKRGTVIGKWGGGRAFCFFLEEELAKTWAEYWKDERFPKPVVRKIQYWGGKGKRFEGHFITNRGEVEIAFCKSFRVVDKVEEKEVADAIK